MFSSIRLFNRLPVTIQSLRKDRINLTDSLVSYLLKNSFYTVAEFF
jgi:hypothetical protein